ncbi:hypothetical protein HGT70_12970 [Rosenbergiella collisarenosi]|uniref:hypothetical protein n=1 Tax=Rosenbergiella collisarenosi TaxID=1544695 RepID=UPI001BD94B7B|nr:hypothetical protein [Rosenbergiella collisarenosi]MBT0722184.1 hypothetical protein [Rosenbergiella collisarenosi]
MLSQGWQIGLHINTAQVSIVAIKGRKNRWSLQRWWVYPLNEPVFTPTGLLENTEELLSILRTFRKYLPYRYSLRISYPSQCVLLRTLSLPCTTLTGLPLERFVQLSVKRLFSHLHELTWDYCLGPDMATEISVTVTRNKILNEYCALFKAVGLQLDVVEIASTALYSLLRQTTNNGLIVEDYGTWLWAIYQPPQYNHGQLLNDNIHTPFDAIKAIAVRCEEYSYSGKNSAENQRGIVRFSAAKLLGQSFAELASHHELTIALGLALREADDL